MATGLIGTSNVSSNTAHLNGGGPGLVTVSGTTLSYTCPSTGVRYAVLTVTGCVQIGSLPAAGADGSNPKVAAGDMCKLMNEIGSQSFSSSIILAPGQSWSAVASSKVWVTGFTTAYPDTNAVLRASVLEVV